MDMGGKLKSYIKAMRELLESGEPLKDPEVVKRELLTEIGFWQHERFVHLIVTFLFAVVTVAVLLVLVFKATIALFLLFVMLLVLLVPYIKHYYVLENGVQTLYVIYEEVTRRTCSADRQCIPEEYGINIPEFKVNDDQIKT